MVVRPYTKNATQISRKGICQIPTSFSRLNCSLYLDLSSLQIHPHPAGAFVGRLSAVLRSASASSPLAPRIRHGLPHPLANLGASIAYTQIHPRSVSPGTRRRARSTQGLSRAADRQGENDPTREREHPFRKQCNARPGPHLRPGPPHVDATLLLVALARSSFG